MMYDCCNTDKMITCICKNDYKYFLKKSNVVGVALGFKRKNSFYTNEKCLQVFVSRKLPKNQICENDLIPYTFKGIETDVIETGIFTECSLREKIRPVKCGYSIGPDQSTGEGTAGCLVTNGVEKFILGSGHVLSLGNEFPIGHSILQPACEFGGRGPRDAIGTLNKYVPLRYIEGGHTPINLTDAALVLLKNKSIATSEIALIGKVTCIKSPVLNAPIKKVGSTTELTEGTITSLNATIEMLYNNGKRALFQDAIITNKIGESGDSGALLINKNNCAVGLLFGSTDNANACCRLNTVFSQLDVHLVK